MEQFSSKEKFSSVVNERDMTIMRFFSLCLSYSLLERPLLAGNLSYCHAYNLPSEGGKNSCLKE